MTRFCKNHLALPFLLLSISFASGQTSFKMKYTNSAIFSGIEVGSKGVKLSVVEIGKGAQEQGAFNILKDTSVNTDFITFNQPTFTATLNGLHGLFNTAVEKYHIDPSSL